MFVLELMSTGNLITQNLTLGFCRNSRIWNSIQYYFRTKISIKYFPFGKVSRKAGTLDARIVDPVLNHPAGGPRRLGLVIDWAGILYDPLECCLGMGLFIVGSEGKGTPPLVWFQDAGGEIPENQVVRFVVFIHRRVAHSLFLLNKTRSVLSSLCNGRV